MGSKGDDCQTFACAIQDCLQKNNYQQEKCEKVIERMLDCCEENQKHNFPSCDGFKFQLEKRRKARSGQPSVKK